MTFPRHDLLKEMKASIFILQFDVTLSNFYKKVSKIEYTFYWKYLSPSKTSVVNLNKKGPVEMKFK